MVGKVSKWRMQLAPAVCGSWASCPAPESNPLPSAPGAFWQWLQCADSTTIDWAAQGVAHEGITIQTTGRVLDHAVGVAQRELVQLFLM